MPTVDELLVRIDANTEQLRRELARAERAVGQSTDSMGRSVKRADESFQKFDRAASGLTRTIKAIAFGAVVTGLQNMTRSALASVDSLSNQADKLGVSVELLQEYRAAAREAAGVTSQTFDLALQRFTRRLAEAAQGQGELKDTLKQYGIAVRDAAGNTRDTQAVLADLANVIKGTSSESERLRIAFKAFDSEGAALVTLLRRGSEGMEQLRASAREAGLVLERDVVERAAEVSARLDVMDQRMAAASNRALIALAPAMEAVAAALANAAEVAGSFLERFAAIENRSLASLREEADGLRDSIVELRVQMAAAPEAAKALASGLQLSENRLAEVEAQILKIVQPRVLEQLNKLFAAHPGLFGGSASAAKDTADSFQLVSEATAELDRELDLAERRLALFRVGGEQAVGMLDLYAEAQDRAAQAAEQFNADNKDAIEAGKLRARTAEDYIEVSVRLARAELDYAEAVDASKEAVKDAEKAEKEATKAREKAAKEQEKLNEELRQFEMQPIINALEDMQRALTDTFERALSGSINSLEDFADEALRIVRRLAANLLAQKLVIPVAAQVGGAFGLSPSDLGFPAAFGQGGGAAGSGFSLNPTSILSNIGSGLDTLGDSFAGFFRQIDSFLGIGPGFSNTGSVAGGIDAAVNAGMGAAIAPASLAFAPFLGFGAAAIMMSLAGKSSGPASAATFGLDAGRLGAVRVGVDNDGDAAIGQGMADSVKSLANGILDQLGADLSVGAFRGELGFVNGQFASSVTAPGLSPVGNFGRPDGTGIYGLPSDLRQFGDDDDAMRAAVLDFVSRSMIVALNEGQLDAGGASNTLKIGLGNIARGAKQGYSQEEFDVIERQLAVLAQFDDLVDTYARTADAVSDLTDAERARTDAIAAQRRELADQARERVAGIFDPVSDVLSTASELFDPAGPASFQTRLNLEDAMRGDSVGAAEGVGGLIAPNADLDWAAVVRGLFDDAGGVRFGRGVGALDSTALDPTQPGLSDVAGLFRSQGFAIGGVSFTRTSSGDETGGNRFRVTDADGNVLGSELVTQPVGDGTDLGTAAKALVEILMEAGADFGDAFIDSFFTPDNRDRVAEAGAVAQGMVQDILDGLTLSDDSTAQGLTGMALVFEQQKATIEALRPELEALNADLEAFGLEAVDVSAAIAEATAELRENVQDTFTQSLEDILDPSGARGRAIAATRDDRRNQAAVLFEGDASGLAGALELIDRVFTAELEQAGLALDEFGNIVTSAADDLTAGIQAAAAEMARMASEQSQVVAGLDTMRNSLRSARLSLSLSEASPLSAREQLDAVETAFEDALARTSSPDADKAQAAREELRDLSDDYLSASKAYFGTSTQHFERFRHIQSVLEAQEGEIDQQLKVARDQLAVLEGIRDRMGAANDNAAVTDFGANPTANRAIDAALRAANLPTPSAYGAGQLNALRLADSRVDQLLRAMGFASGGVFQGGGVMPFAQGGVITGPTMFPMRTGFGLMGEAGPEAIMPLSRRGGRLGVAGPSMAGTEAALADLGSLLARGLSRMIEAEQATGAEVAALRRVLRAAA